MDRKVFLAGATGAIGKRLVPLLLDAGYEVFAQRAKPLGFKPRAPRQL
jgi:nucleoside-diphosphate-sugar epimerase